MPSNTVATSSIVMRETGRRFVNTLQFANNVTRSFDDEFKYPRGSNPVGYTVNARLPWRPVVSEGQALQLQPILDATVPISLTHQKHVGFGWSTADRSLLIADVKERYINPSADALANIVDFDGLQTVTRDVFNSVGTPGTIPTSNLTYLQGGAKLTKYGVSTRNRRAILEPLTMATLVNANQNLFGVPRGQAASQWKNGQFSDEALGVGEWFQDQNVYMHTYGTYGGTPVVNGAGQTGSSLVTSGWSSGASTLNKGDTFTIAGVFSVNAMNRTTTGQLQDFVVTATVSDAAGAMTIGISPSIITSGQLQTVDSSPANSAAITVRGASATAGSPQTLIYDPSAFALVFGQLHSDLAGADVAMISDKQLGLSIRHVEQYQIGVDQEPNRLDILYGWATVRPEMALRVQG